MRIASVIGIGLLSVAIVGCTTAHERAYLAEREEMRNNPALFEEAIRRCIKKARAADPSWRKSWAPTFKIKEADFPAVYCRRSYTAYVEGRIPYKEYMASVDTNATAEYAQAVVRKR